MEKDKTYSIDELKQIGKALELIQKNFYQKKHTKTSIETGKKHYLSLADCNCILKIQNKLDMIFQDDYPNEYDKTIFEGWWLEKGEKW